MTATGHALIGALIAAKVTNPIVGIPLAVASHFACDYLPHWDSGTNGKKKSKQRFFIESVIDVSASFIVSYVLYTTLLSGSNIFYLYLCVFAAQLPDWLYVPYYYLNFKKPPISTIAKFQDKCHNQLDKPWGILSQVAAVSIVYIVFFHFL